MEQSEPDKVIITEPIPAPLAVIDEVVTDQALSQSFKEMGLTEVSSSHVTNLRKIGAFAHQNGTIRIQHGRVLVSQEHLNDAIRAIRDEIIKLAADTKAKGRINAINRLSQTLGYLIGKMTDSHNAVVAMSGGRSQIPATGIDEDVVPSFRPGAQVRPREGHTVIVAREAHVHSPTPR